MLGFGATSKANTSTGTATQAIHTQNAVALAEVNQPSPITTQTLSQAPVDEFHTQHPSTPSQLEAGITQHAEPSASEVERNCIKACWKRIPINVRVGLMAAPFIIVGGSLFIYFKSRTPSRGEVIGDAIREGSRLLR